MTAEAEVWGGGMLNGFYGSKTSHTATSNDISLITLKAGMIARLVCIHEEDLKWHFNGKVIDKFG